MEANGLCHSCAHATKCQFASLMPHMKMKIFSCQHIHPQGDGGSLLSAPCLWPRRTTSPTKRKAPSSSCQKVDAFSDRALKPKLSALLPEPGEQRGENVQAPRDNKDAQRPQKKKRAGSTVTTLRRRIRTRLYLRPAPRRHGAAALSFVRDTTSPPSLKNASDGPLLTRIVCAREFRPSAPWPWPSSASQP